MRLTIYTRTSTMNGAGGDSLDAQADACRAWAEAHGHEVASVHRDEAVSGGLPVQDRPGLLAALMALETDAADGLIVHRLDRLARELHVQEAALAHAWTIGASVAVYEAVEGEVKRDDPNDPHRRFLRQVLGAAAELERGLIRARLHGGRRRKSARGEWVGGHRLHRRFGYEVVNGAFVAVAREQAIIARLKAGREAGQSYRAIAAELNTAGIAAPAGSAWLPATIQRVLKREALHTPTQ